MYGLVVTAGPAKEPLGLAEAKRHLRLDGGDEDEEVKAWVAAARRLAEQHTGRRLVTQTLKLTLPDFPDCWVNGVYGAVRIPTDPVQAVTSVKYYDVNGTLTTLTTADYQVDLAHQPPLLAPAPTKVWPTTQADRLAPVEITFTAGYGDTEAAVPEGFKAAIKLALGYWYENRGDGRDPSQQGLPPAAIRLLDGLSGGGY